MEKSTLNAKFFFAAIAAFLLVISVVAIVPRASSSSTPDLAALTETLNPKEVTPASNLYKYLHHVGVTQYPWGFAYNASMLTASAGPGPKTDHLLWKTFLGSLDWYNDPVAVSHNTPIITNGLCIVGNTKTARDPMMWGLDQNTGEIIWAARTKSFQSNSFIIDNERFVSGTDVYSIETGQWLYSVTRGPSIYISEMHLAITSGPSAANGGATFMGWDWSDTTKAPVSVWTTDPTQITLVSSCQPCYGNGKIYVYDTDDVFYAIDAMTGQKVWRTQAVAASCTCSSDNLAYAYGRLYYGTYTGQCTEHCLDAETGARLWDAPLDGQQTRGQVITNGVVAFYEMGSHFWGLDAYDGHALWKHLCARNMPLLHAQASGPEDLGPEGYGKTPMHV